MNTGLAHARSVKPISAREVRFIPTHLAPYLGPEASAALLQTPVVWNDANPVYVVE